MFLASCPCAVTTSPSLLNNVAYGGKCYLLYYNASTIQWNQADARCRSPTTTGCDGGSDACISGTGVGRLATFDTWADYTAVTNLFDIPTENVAIGMQCSSAGRLSNYNPYANCNPPPSIPGGPSCSQWQNGTDVVIQSPWAGGFNGYSNGVSANYYICETSKIFSKLLLKLFYRSNLRTLRWRSDLKLKLLVI